MDRVISKVESSTRKKKVFIWLGACILVLTFVFFAASDFLSPESRWYEVAEHSVSRVVSGRAITVPARISVIAADGPGTVIELRSRVGDHLEKGDVLVILKSTALADSLLEARQKLALAKAHESATEAQLIDERMARQTQLLKSRNDMLVAQQQAKAKQALVKQGAVSRLDLSSAQLHADMAKAVYTSNKRRLQKLKQAQGAKRNSARTEVRIASDTVKHLSEQERALTVRAKHSGWLTKLKVTPGEHVSAGGVIAEMIGGGLYADIQIAQVDAPSVKVGEPVVLSSSVGKVKAIVRGVMPRAIDGNVHVRASLVAPPKWLRADMNMNAHIHSDRSEKSLYVKSMPSFDENATERVWRRKDKTREKSLALVHFGRLDGKYIQIISGVNAGDLISPLKGN